MCVKRCYGTPLVHCVLIYIITWTATIAFSKAHTPSAAYDQLIKRIKYK